MASNKRINKAYVRYDGTGRVIAGSLILNRFKPQVGNWQEIDAYECCNPAPAILSLRLLFSNILEVGGIIGDVTDVATWNTFFDLPANGTAFTSVSVVGDEIQLFGGGNITLVNGLFSDLISLIVEFDDAGSVVVQGGNAVFDSCSSLTTVNLPAITSIGYNFAAYTAVLTSFTAPLLQNIEGYTFGTSGITTVAFPSVTTVSDYGFEEATNLISISLPACINLGSSVGDDGVFSSITGNTITLTVPAALMTTDAGNPDGDIVYLQANNTVTVVTV